MLLSNLVLLYSVNKVNSEPGAMAVAVRKQQNEQLYVNDQTLEQQQVLPLL